MPRILLLIMLIWIVYVVVKRFIAKSSFNKNSATERAQTEKIVACHQCGLHVPESESRTINGDTYCHNSACYTQDE